MAVLRVLVVGVAAAGVIACTPAAPVDAIPQAIASADHTTGNAPLTVHFTGQGIGGNPPLTYQWDFGDGGAASTADATHTYPLAGSYHAVLTVTDADGDADEDDLTVQVSNSILAARIGGTPLSGKAPLQVQFTAGVTGGTTPYQSAWDFGDGATSTSENPVHVYQNGGQYQVGYTVTDEKGKKASGNLQISVSDATKPAATSTASPTSGPVPLTVAFQGSATGGSTPYTWLWDFGDGTPKSKAQSPSHTYQNAGTYTASLTVTDAGGATDTRSVQIGATTNSVPVASASATPTKGIAPLQVAFTGQATGGDKPLTWGWDFGDGGTSTQPSPTHTYKTAGVYTATLTVTDLNGDSSKAQATVSVGNNQIPKVTASAKPTSGPAPLTVSFSGAATGGNAPLTFSWDFGDGGTSTVQNPSHTYQNAGTYTATVVVKDANGDTDTSTVTVTVATASQPVVTASASPASGQAPLAVSFYASAQGGTAPLTWQWNFGDGTTGATTANTTHTYQAAGTYTAQVVVTDANGNADSATVTIQVSSPSVPHAKAFADVASGIAPLKVTFSSQVTGGTAPMSYAWDFGDGAGATGPTATHTYQTAGTYTVLLTVTDATSATSTDSLSISVASNSVPTVSASASPASGAPPLAVAFTATSSGGNAPLTYKWDFGDGSTATAQNPSHTYQSAGVYTATVVVTDANGDSASASTQILVQQQLPDLTVSGLTIAPQGAQVVFRFTVTNQGNADSPAFNVDIYPDRSTAPAQGQAGPYYLPEQPLAAGASRSDAGFVTLSAGTRSGWIQADGANAVAESDETNNVAGPVSYTVYGALVINELLYDPPGADQGCFIELHGPPGTDLSGYTLVGVNGADGSDYATIDLTGQTVRSNGFFVVAQDSTVDPSVVDLVDPKANLQNGPDSLQLRFGTTVIDAVGYGDFTNAIFAGEGTPAPDPSSSTVDYSSIGRDASSTDTNDNGADFHILDYPTPGAVNPISGDTCAYAIPVSGSATVTGTTTGAYDDYGALMCGAGTYEPDVVYAIPLTAGQTLTATVTQAEAGFDTVLYLRTVCTDYTTEVACNDDGPNMGTNSQLVYTASASGTYYLILDGYGSASGNSGTYTMTLNIQ